MRVARVSEPIVNVFIQWSTDQDGVSHGECVAAVDIGHGLYRLEAKAIAFELSRGDVVYADIVNQVLTFKWPVPNPAIN